MTHEEARSLFPSYALGALEDAAELEAHLDRCASCSATLGEYLETTARLGEAVALVQPPEKLRAAILVADAPPHDLAPRALSVRRLDRYVLTALAALVIVALGLAAVTFFQQRQLQSTRNELALDRQGLALLTSTETTVQRLQPVVALGPNAHGHWFHRSGIPTQVLVIEFMPQTPAGESYYGWLRRADGSWEAVGRFSIDRQGYARIILTGSDGADAREAIVTRQSADTATPAGTTVLRWTAA